MKELYFISVLGGLKIGSLIIIGLACLIIFIIVLNISVGDINEEMAKYKKPAIYMLAIGLFMNIIIPSKSDLFMIYGIGGTIDYIKSNDKSIQIPDKVINVIDKWISEYEHKNDTIK